MNRVCTALAAGLVLAACGGPSAASPEVTEPVAIIDIVRSVEYYPGCSNELVEIDGTTWYPLAEFEFADEVVAIEATPRMDPAVGPAGFAPQVAAPGPGDDTGTLVIYEDGVARYQTDNGFVIWLTKEVHTYNWVC